MDALIGHTGFVGATLACQHEFGAGFNSRSISSAAEGDFDTVVCAAAPGSMFEANRFPDRDSTRIQSLMGSLRTIKAKRFVLVSSIAVLADFGMGDDETTSALQTGLAYGRNRAQLETFCAAAFDHCLIVRLPALFGPGLKKNFLFDILNPMPTMLPATRLDQLKIDLPAALADGIDAFYRLDPEIDLFVIDRAALEDTRRRDEYDASVTANGFSAVNFTNPGTRFQYYDMTRLWSDIRLGLARNLPLLHLAPEPVGAADVYQRVTGQSMPGNASRLHMEDMRTQHANLWGRGDHYIAGSDTVLDAITRFFVAERRGVT